MQVNRSTALRTLLFASVVVTALSPRISRAATNCGVPSPNQAIVWQDDFSGVCDVLDIGDYPFSRVLTLSVGNDTISSVSVGANVKITLFDDDLPPIQGAWVSSTQSRSVASDLNDRTSSIKVSPRSNCSPPGPDQAVVWTDNFSGDCDVLEIGTYSFQQLLGLSVGNDRISSVSLGANVFVRLYEGHLFETNGLLISTSRSVVTDFNDVTSALQVGIGHWTKTAVDFPATRGPIAVQLLMDGTILANDSTPSSDGQRNPSASHWYRYTPLSGKYTNGTWAEVGSSHYGRGGYASGMLKDGRFFVGGGEYVWDQNGIPYLPAPHPDGIPANVQPDQFYLDHCEIFDPRTNRWTDAPDYPHSHFLADGVAAPLPDGRLLVGAAYRNNNGSGVLNTQSYVFNPYTNPATWTTLKELDGRPPYFAEGSLNLLQNDNVFLAENGGAEYGTASQSWTGVLQWPANNPFLKPSMVGEGAGTLTLYDGRVLIVGGTGFNAIYSPNATGSVNPAGNAIQNTSIIPYLDEGDELGQSLMPTGNALVAAHDGSGRAHFSEYWARTGYSYDASLGGPAFWGVTQTPLPDGTIMVASPSTKQIYIYEPGAPQQVAFGRPTIDRVTGPVAGVYTMNGRTLNGLTNGANQDDEVQNYTSFPVVSVTYRPFSTGSPVTRYCFVESVSTMSIAPGRASTVRFRLPDSIPSRKSLSVAVSASGLRSNNTVTIVSP